MRKLLMEIIENVTLMGMKYQCTVLREIVTREGVVGLVVNIDPPLPIPSENEVRDKNYVRDLNALFTNGIDKAILQSRWQGFSISQKVENGPTMVYVLIPEGRSDWEWGPMHVAQWAIVSEIE